MKSKIHLIFLFFFSFILLVDAISLLGILNDFSILRQTQFIILYCLFPVTFIIGLKLYARNFLALNRPGFFASFYVFAGYFLSFYIPKLLYTVFLLLEFLIKLPAYIIYRFFPEPVTFLEFLLAGPLNFISLLVLPFSILSLFIILSGMLFGRFNFKVRRHEVRLADLPEEFDGFKLVHISDLHLGSLHGHQDKIRKAIQLINRESPDLILFTGDLVNNLAEETQGWTELLSGMKSRYGNFSILGNHDYGEYYNWPNEELRMENIRQLHKAHKDSGLSLLLNRSEQISKGGQRIYVAGVENWGLPPFKQYGDLGKAMHGIPSEAFTILLSHDPSHWDAEVMGKATVQLTLSGHTHGMQFGLRFKKFTWSPVQMKYPRWVGLYQQGNQYLHVNPGLGYIGYAGRIGIPPEISLITLKKIT